MSDKPTVKEGNEKTKRKDPLDNTEAIKNLLIINLIKDGVNPKAIEIATGIPEMTIRARFPMKLIKKNKSDLKNEPEIPE
jgi:hypothetical protein